MKQLFSIVVACTVMVGFFALITPVYADGNIKLLYGSKSLDEDDWSPVEDQVAYGLLTDVKLAEWPLAIALDFVFSSDNTNYAGTDVEGKTNEFDLGIRWYSNAINNLRFYAGGGLARIAGEFEAYSISDSDDGYGYWINAGIMLTLQEHFNLGVDFRYSKAQIDLFGVEGEAGGALVGVFAGLTF